MAVPVSILAAEKQQQMLADIEFMNQYHNARAVSFQIGLQGLTPCPKNPS